MWEDIGQVLKEYSSPIVWKFPPQQIHNPAWTNELNPYPGQWSVENTLGNPKCYGIPYLSVSQKWSCWGLGCWVFLRSGHSRRSPFGSCFSPEFSWSELRQQQAGAFFCFFRGHRGVCFKHIPKCQSQKLHFTNSKLLYSEFCNTCPQHKAGAGWDQTTILCSRGHYFPSLSGQQPT